MALLGRIGAWFSFAVLLFVTGCNTFTPQQVTITANPRSPQDVVDHASLGIASVPTTDKSPLAWTVPGVLITVASGSTAEEAGFASGDVILTLDGIATPNTSRLTELIGSYSKGIPRSAQVSRASATVTVKAVLPSASNRRLEDWGFSSMENGSAISSARQTYLENQKASPDTAGLAVMTIVSGSSADAAGIVPGDILTALGGEPLLSLDALLKALYAFPPGSATTITFLRDGQLQTQRVVLGRSRSVIPAIAVAARESLGSVAVNTTDFGIEGIPVTVRHPDFDPVALVVKPKKVEPDWRPKIIAIPPTSLSIGFLILGIQKVNQKDNYDTYGYKVNYKLDNSGVRAEGQTMLTFAAVSGLVAVSAFLFTPPGHFITYEPSYSINLAPASRYDDQGFHKTTGFNKFGVNRQGFYLNGDSFTGTIEAGKKQGYGVFTRALAGTRTYGDFENDAPSGPVLVADKADNLAVEVWKAGSMLDSHLVAGDAQFRGVKLVYLGTEARGGLADGPGDARTLDNKLLVREGVFQQGKLTSGSLVFSDGLKLSGKFQNDQLVEGTEVRSNGSRYSGTFSQGLYHGRGTLEFPGGEVYQGDFRSGRMDGAGTYRFRSGAVYTGAVQNGTFEGTGKLTSANNESFEGPFHNGQAHGTGIYRKGSTVESAEYYEGKRIDQAYLIRVEREKAQADAERRRADEEQARLDREEQEANRREQEARAAKIQRDLATPSPLAGIVSRSGPTALDEAGRQSREDIAQTYGSSSRPGLAASPPANTSVVAPSAPTRSTTPSAPSPKPVTGTDNQPPYVFGNGWWESYEWIPQKDIDLRKAKVFSQTLSLSFQKESKSIMKSGWMKLPGHPVEVQVTIQDVSHIILDEKTLKRVNGPEWRFLTSECRSTDTTLDAGVGANLRADLNEILIANPPLGDTYTASVPVRGGYLTKAPARSAGGGVGQ